MNITKCDICKKTIVFGEEKFHLAHLGKSNFDSFEFCVKCSEPITKMLKAKKLVKDGNKKIRGK